MSWPLCRRFGGGRKTELGRGSDCRSPSPNSAPDHLQNSSDASLSFRSTRCSVHRESTKSWITGIGALSALSANNGGSAAETGFGKILTKKERRQVHWTRGPSNVPRRTRLTPRNLRDRNLPVHGDQPPPNSKSKEPNPKIRFPRPASKGLLLPRPGVHGTSPRKETRRNRPSAWIVPANTAKPEGTLQGLPNPTNLDTPTG